MQDFRFITVEMKSKWRVVWRTAVFIHNLSTHVII